MCVRFPFRSVLPSGTSKFKERRNGSHLLALVCLVLRIAHGMQKRSCEDMLGRCEGILSRSSQRCKNPSHRRVTHGAELNLILPVIQ